MRVLIAPDGFPGALAASAVAAALAAGWRRARPHDDVALLPMADGGDGLAEVVARAVPGAERRESEVADARGVATSAEWLLLPDRTAVIETARVCGLHRLPPDRRDPLLTTTYGVGQLLRAAVDAGAARVVVGLGDSATVEGGVGAVIALGCELRREDGNGVKVGGRWAGDLHHVQSVKPLDVPVFCAADVPAPLLGPEGAARRYGPPKGADGEAVHLLEANLGRVADVVERDLPGGPWRDLPGAGAGGGLGFGLAAFVGAELRPGAAEVARLVGLEAALEDVDVVVTGEDHLGADRTQASVCCHLAGRAADVGARIMVVTGSADPGAGQRYDAVSVLGEEPTAADATDVADRFAAAAGTLAADLGSRAR